MSWPRLVKDLLGAQPTLDPKITAVEVGPWDEPICGNCYYIDGANELPEPGMHKRLIGADARKIPLKNGSIDLIISKNFPWFLPASVKRRGADQVFADMIEMRRRNGLETTHEEMQKWLEDSFTLITDIFAEYDRVLSPRGTFLVLSNFSDQSDIEMLISMSDFLIAGQKHGFKIQVVNRVQAATSLRLQGATNNEMVGLAFHRPNSLFKPPCESWLELP